MNIALVTTAYNGYGRFADQWLGAIDDLKTKPTEIVIMLGNRSGLDLKHADLLVAKYKDLNVKFYQDTTLPTLMGPMRNAVVEKTSSEWVMYLSIDDVILPDAIDILSEHEDTADYICITWQSIEIWEEDAELKTHTGYTPEDLFKNYKAKGFIVGHSPFRRSFWEKTPYADHDYPNAPFVGDLIESGARFAKTTEPCTRYLRRLDSHAARLGRRKETLIRSEKAKAVYYRNQLRSRILNYYKER